MDFSYYDPNNAISSCFFVFTFHLFCTVARDTSTPKVKREKVGEREREGPLLFILAFTDSILELGVTIVVGIID